MRTSVKYILQAAAMGTVIFAGSTAVADEEDIDLSEVPANVMAAATAAVAGIRITEAEVEEKDGQRIYELEGSANGIDYEIEVASDGTVRKVEEDD